MKEDKKRNIEKIINDTEIDYIMNGIINALLFENEIQRKKLKRQKLSKREQFFDNYFLSPSFMLNYLLKIK